MLWTRQTGQGKSGLCTVPFRNRIKLLGKKIKWRRREGKGKEKVKQRKRKEKKEGKNEGNGDSKIDVRKKHDILP